MLNNIVMIYQKTILNKINIFVTELLLYKQDIGIYNTNVH